VGQGKEGSRLSIRLEIYLTVVSAFQDKEHVTSTNPLKPVVTYITCLHIQYWVSTVTPALTRLHVPTIRECTQSAELLRGCFPQITHMDTSYGSWPLLRVTGNQSTRRETPDHSH